jgi:hemerythrin
VTLLLTWNHACAVGVQAMDDQHAILIDTMNELRLALVRGTPRERQDELLHKLIEFTHMHFLSEEHLLERHGFPGLAGHLAEHQRLLAQLQEALHRLQHGEAVPTADVLCFLHDWFLNHVEGQDKQYGPWLNERGVD